MRSLHRVLVMRDTEFGVKINVLLTGDYPGDGKPKSVCFPDPAVAIHGQGFRVLSIKDLVELKLASGLTNPDRLKDLADVQELIRHASIPLELARDLDTLVRGKFTENLARNPAQRRRRLIQHARRYAGFTSFSVIS